MKLGFLSTLQTVGTLTTKIAIVAAASIGGTALVSSSVFAALSATASNGTAQSVTSGTLSLTSANNGNGFSTTVSAMAPGDVVNRYVTYTNAGTLDAQGLNLTIADSGSTALTSNGTTGLQVTVTGCSVAWTAATGVCGGTTANVAGTDLLASTSLLGLKTVAGVVNSGVITSAAIKYYKFSITLPNTTEVTANGVFPGGTIQGLTATITWTLTAAQKTAATTNS